ncbi:hypothetical protein OH76DRAFT_276036 [Lentinus brumalis]|uniref:Uncharacterized protein n=1 Tax=Lentinus brumalis TaxID=2498619 RepID=A0A371CL39_9APHY|nr:hypothetical protein OH76DRAFT_276036 [Polyporus brumalis]
MGHGRKTLAVLQAQSPLPHPPPHRHHPASVFAITQSTRDERQGEGHVHVRPRRPRRRAQCPASDGKRPINGKMAAAHTHWEQVFRNKKYSRSFSFGIRLCLNLPLVPDSDSDTTHVLALPEQPPPAGLPWFLVGRWRPSRLSRALGSEHDIHSSPSTGTGCKLQAARYARTTPAWGLRSTCIMHHISYATAVLELERPWPPAQLPVTC